MAARKKAKEDTFLHAKHQAFAYHQIGIIVRYKRRSEEKLAHPKTEKKIQAANKLFLEEGNHHVPLHIWHFIATLKDKADVDGARRF